MLLNCHELIGFSSPELSQEIIEYVCANDKPVYRAVLAAVAEAQRVRPVFFERKPRRQRHADMIAMLSRPRLEEAAASILRGWLLGSEKQLIARFLEALDIPHKEGVVDDFPAEVDSGKLNAAIDGLLEDHSADRVIIYLNTVRATSGVRWPALDQRLQEDERLHLA